MIRQKDKQEMLKKGKEAPECGPDQRINDLINEFILDWGGDELFGDSG